MFALCSYSASATKFNPAMVMRPMLTAFEVFMLVVTKSETKMDKIRKKEHYAFEQKHSDTVAYCP